MNAFWRFDRLVPSFPTTRAKLPGIASFDHTKNHTAIFLKCSEFSSARSKDFIRYYTGRLYILAKTEHQEWLSNIQVRILFCFLWCPMSAKNQLLHFTIWYFEDHIHFIKITTLFLKITGLSVENTTYFLKTNFWRPTFEDQLLIPNRNPMSLLFAGSFIMFSKWKKKTNNTCYRLTGNFWCNKFHRPFFTVSRC
jgi:hypothetical protein